MPDNTPPGDFVTSHPSKLSPVTILHISIYWHSYRTPDLYHTLYALSGLSTAQHSVAQTNERKEELRKSWKPTGGVSFVMYSPWETYLTSRRILEPSEVEGMHKIAYVEQNSWAEEENVSVYVNGAGDRLVSTKINTPSWLLIPSSRSCEECDTPNIEHDDNTF